MWALHFISFPLTLQLRFKSRGGVPLATTTFWQIQVPAGQEENSSAALLLAPWSGSGTVCLPSEPALWSHPLFYFNLARKPALYSHGYLILVSFLPLPNVLHQPLSLDYGWQLQCVCLWHWALFYQQVLSLKWSLIARSPVGNHATHQFILSDQVCLTLKPQVHLIPQVLQICMYQHLVIQISALLLESSPSVFLCYNCFLFSLSSFSLLFDFKVKDILIINIS